MIETQLPVLLILSYILFALLVPAFGLFREQWAQPLATLGSGIATSLSVYGFWYVLQNGAIRYFFGNWAPPIGIEFVYDGLSAFFVLIINSIGLMVLLHSAQTGQKELASKRMPYYALSMLMLLGFNGMILTGDLFNLFVFLEIASLSGYALIAVGDRPAPYAAFRYLIIGTVGGTLYLLGVGLLYTVTGTLNMIDMASLLPELASHRSVIAALILIVAGMGIKAALFPLHGWLPDAYTFAPSVTSSLIAPIGTKVAAYVLFRLLYWVFGTPFMDGTLPILEVIGVLSGVGIVFGSVMAIAQTEIKRMFAYSSVSQIGYILMGLSLANPWGFAGALLHVLNHAVMKALLFMVSGHLRLKEGHSDIRRFHDAYRKKYPWTMAAFTVGAVSMVGLPPLAGFFSKWYLALGTVENSNWVLLSVILVSSLLNAVYFFRILEKVYMADPSKAQKEPGDGAYSEPGFSAMLPLAVLALSLFVIGFANAAIVSFLLNLYPF